MFFSNLKDLAHIAKQNNFTIFTIPNDIKITPSLLGLPSNTIIISPSENETKIKIDQIRNLTSFSLTKQSQPPFFLVYPAETLTIAAQNSILKILEEPKSYYYFIFITKNPKLLLPTIVSRAQVFIFHQPIDPLSPPNCSNKEKDLAKQLISAQKIELINLAKKLADQKPEARPKTQAIVAIAIEILYKSFLKTKDPRFLKRLSHFINLHHALEQNGNLRLQIIANLL